MKQECPGIYWMGLKEISVNTKIFFKPHAEDLFVAVCLNMEASKYTLVANYHHRQQ